MYKKRSVSVLFVLFYTILLVMLIKVPLINAEETPQNTDISEPSTQNQAQTDTENIQRQPETEKHQEPPQPENQEIKPEPPPPPKNPTPQKSFKKAKKAPPPIEKKEEENPKVETPVQPEQTPVQVQVTLPDISDDGYCENTIIIPSNGKISQEKLIKGIIAWVMILSGLSLIIWVILNNRKISKYSNKIINRRKSSKILGKQRIYYKKSNRK